MNLKTLHKISYGLYIICSKNKDKYNGQIANVLFQVTAEPPTIAVSINKQNLTHDFIEKSKVFTISVLSEDTPLTFIGTFGFKSGRVINKLKGINYKIGKTKLPIILDYAIAYIECKLIEKIDIGTHTIFIADVIEADIINNKKPMTYEFYHKVKGGFSPKSAPTYLNELDKNKEKGGKKMDSYVCNVCGYIYDPEVGDPDNGISAGTKFEDLPDNWVCPICGAGKDAFSKK